MTYRIEFSAHAARQFRKLPSEARARIAPEISSLADNARPHGAKKLAGHQSGWRLRVGDYRVLYDVNDSARRVLVVEVGHRRQVYRRV